MLTDIRTVDNYVIGVYLYNMNECYNNSLRTSEILLDTGLFKMQVGTNFKQNI